MDKMENSIHRKLSGEQVAVQNPKNDRTKSIACKIFHPRIVFWVAIVEFFLLKHDDASPSHT